MIIAKKLERIDPEAARRLDWRKLTHELGKDFIEALIDMQSSSSDKLAVADMIQEALHSSSDIMLFGDETAEHIERIKSQIRNGVYSPYQEIERLIDEGKYKDDQIDIMMGKLKDVRQTGSQQEEADLLTRIVEEAKNLGPMGVLYTEVMLRRIYSEGNEVLDELKAAMRDDCRMQYTFNAPVGVVC